MADQERVFQEPGIAAKGTVDLHTQRPGKWCLAHGDALAFVQALPLGSVSCTMTDAP